MARILLAYPLPASNRTRYSEARPIKCLPRRCSNGAAGIADRGVRSQPRARRVTAMLSISSDGPALSSRARVSRHSSYSLSAARRSTEKARDSILSRIASSQSSSSDNIRVASCSISLVSPRRRQLSSSMPNALIMPGSSLACTRSFQRANSPESGISIPQDICISSGLSVSPPSTSPDASRSRSSASLPRARRTWSRLDSMPPGPNRGRRIDKAVAKEWRASVMDAFGQKNSASRSRLWDWRASTDRYTRSARCFFVRNGIGSPAGENKAG